MELRWLTADEQRSEVVESASLTEVLNLAQRLQSEGEGRYTEQQLVEMGRELGIQPQYIQEALRLRRAPTAPPVPQESRPLPPAIRERPRGATVGRALFLGLGMATFPLALASLADSGAHTIALLAFVGAVAAGWAARETRQAGRAGALVTPAVLFITALFLGPSGPHFRSEALFLAALSFTPLGSAVGRGAAGVRRWLERVGERAGMAERGR